MTDLLEKGSTWLEDQRTRHLTRLVAYQRGANSVEVKATIGRTIFEQTDDLGVLQKTESRDYLVRTADLVLGGTPTLPRAGDRIRETGSDKVFVYEVMAPGGEPAFRFSDPYRQGLRIHTKQIGIKEP